MTLAPDVRRPLTQLRGILAIDAVTTGATGVIYLLVSGSLARLFEVESGLVLALGALLAAYGAGVAVLAARPVPNDTGVRVVVALNTGWVVLTVIALPAGWVDPGPVGLGWAIVKAVVVGGFALVQVWALRRWRVAR